MSIRNPFPRTMVALRRWVGDDKARRAVAQHSSGRTQAALDSLCAEIEQLKQQMESATTDLADDCRKAWDGTERRRCDVCGGDRQVWRWASQTFEPCPYCVRPGEEKAS